MPNTITFFVEKFYNSPGVLSMPFKIRSLYKYTILNPSRSCSGVYTLPISKICFETGLNQKEVENGLKLLESKHKKLFYEFNLQLIFVFTIFKLMPKSKNIFIAVKNDFVYNNVTARIIKEFNNRYPNVLNPLQTPYKPSFTDTDTDTDTDTEKDNKQKKADAFILPEHINTELWDEFITHRKKRKAPNTPRALNAVIKRIESLKAEGHDPNTLIEKMLERNWLTVEKEWLESGAQDGKKGRKGLSEAAAAQREKDIEEMSKKLPPIQYTE